MCYYADLAATVWCYYTGRHNSAEMAFKLPNQPYEARLWHGTRTLAPFEIIKHQVTLCDVFHYCLSTYLTVDNTKVSVYLQSCVRVLGMRLCT
jgi:hypothetical protein